MGNENAWHMESLITITLLNFFSRGGLQFQTREQVSGLELQVRGCSCSQYVLSPTTRGTQCPRFCMRLPACAIRRIRTVRILQGGMSVSRCPSLTNPSHIRTVSLTWATTHKRCTQLHSTALRCTHLRDGLALPRRQQVYRAAAERHTNRPLARFHAGWCAPPRIQQATHTHRFPVSSLNLAAGRT